MFFLGEYDVIRCNKVTSSKTLGDQLMTEAGDHQASKRDRAMRVMTSLFWCLAAQEMDGTARYSKHVCSSIGKG